MKGIPSFIKIDGAVSEKNGDIGQTFVVLYIGYRECGDARNSLIVESETLST